MGSECTNCSKCDLGIISESKNEIDRQSLDYRKGNIKRDILLNNNNIINYYKNYLPKIIYLQIRIKKFLLNKRQFTNPKDDFYNKYYGTIELSPENLEIIGTNNELADINNKGELFHKIQNSKDKFKTLSQKYSSIQNNQKNDLPEEKNIYKVKDFKINEKAKYTGDMLNGKQHGYGIQEWEDGAKYEGEWKNGKTNGYGIFYHPEGDIYKGYWKDDKAHGHGTYIKKDEEQYEGEWANDCQDGYGVETWYDGSTYKGYYKNGKKNGIGEYIWPDGSKYFGQWKDNIHNGFATYTYVDNKKSYEGYFANNAFEGDGHYIKFIF